MIKRIAAIPYLNGDGRIQPQECDEHGQEEAGEDDGVVGRIFRLIIGEHYIRINSPEEDLELPYR